MVIAIVALFIGLLVAFAVIILLYMKVSQLKDVEHKQQIMMRELDQSVSAYLVDMKEENDRFLAELQRTKKPASLFNEPIETPKVKAAPYVPPMPDEEVVAFEVPVVPKKKAASVYASQPPKAPLTKRPTFEEAMQQAVETPAEKPPQTLQQQIQQMREEGQTIEQIAKALNKGKTEVELLLKFNLQK
ncbi:hypothetical protein [Caryophanon tenue]|uniref:Swarming motility protein SwrB n=1 Tax=Caryophanon tenue TaxID=33978 RepID=A0A1C0YKN1_9BACL|nr:hypothetical protein [Caryophanon tenue]OCS87701.1 hypothetical protein A6M13_10385 [Caryophanon tenue]